MNFHTVRILFVALGIEPKARMVSVGGDGGARLRCNSPDQQVFTLNILLTWHTAIRGDERTRGNSEAFASSIYVGETNVLGLRCFMMTFHLKQC